MLFSDDPEDHDEFLSGLVSAATIVMTFFTCWLLFVSLLKWLGQERVGMFAGYPYQHRNSKRAMRGRSIYAFSSLMILIFSILLMTEGLKKLQGSVDTIEAANQEIISIHDEFLVTIWRLKDAGSNADNIRFNIEDFLKQDLCLLQPNSAITDVLEPIESLGGFLDEEIEGLIANLKIVEKATSLIDDKLGRADLTGTTPTFVVVFFCLVTLSLSFALLLGWYEVFSESYYFLVTWFALPVFVLFVIAAFIGAGGVLMLGQANSDWCLGDPFQSPEGSIYSIMQRRGMEKSALYYQTVQFYSSQCRDENPWQFLEGFYGDMKNATESLEAFVEAISSTESQPLLELGCGGTLGPVLELLDQFLSHATALMDAGSKAIDLVKCKNIVPLYTRTVYEATCVSSIRGTKWCFVSLLMISVFGMLMITFRGAYYPIGYYYEDDGKSLYSADEDDELLDFCSDDDSFISESRVNDDVYIDSRDDRGIDVDTSSERDNDLIVSSEASRGPSRLAVK